MQFFLQELDAEFLQKFRTSPDGTTLVVALVVGTKLFTAWARGHRRNAPRRSLQLYVAILYLFCWLLGWDSGFFIALLEVTNLRQKVARTVINLRCSGGRF